MAEEWENLVIETGVDTLLNYLAENRKASVSDISEDLGVSEERIKDWADALASNNFIEKNYSARHGLVLKYSNKNRTEAEKKVEKLRQEVEQKTEEIEMEMESRQEEVDSAKKKLKKMTEELEENREKEEEVKEQLEELEELEEELEKSLEAHKKEESVLRSHSIELISRIDSVLNRIEEAEEKADRFEQEKDEIKRKVKALKKLEEHAKKAEDIEEKLEEVEQEKTQADSLFSSFTEKMSNLFSSSSTGKNRQEMLSGNVNEVKERIDEMEDPDLEALLKAEIQGKNRQTVKRYIQRQKADSDSG